jgi:hypothetical protein
MQEFIELKNKEKRQMICRTFGVTNANLSQALRYQRNSKTAIAMRKMATENGGKEYQLIKNK